MLASLAVFVWKSPMKIVVSKGLNQQSMSGLVFTALICHSSLQYTCMDRCNAYNTVFEERLLYTMKRIFGCKKYLPIWYMFRHSKYQLNLNSSVWSVSKKTVMKEIKTNIHDHRNNRSKNRICIILWGFIHVTSYHYAR